MKFNRDLPEKRWAAYSIATCSAVLLYVLLGNLPSIVRGFSAFLSYISPVLMGVIIAYVLDPVAKVYQRYLFRWIKSPRRARILSCVVAILSVTIFLIVLMVALVPQIVSSIATLVGNVGNYAASARNLLGELEHFAAEHNVDISSVTEAGDSLVATLARLIPNNLGSIVNTSFNIGKSAFTAIISFILAIYFLLDKEPIGRAVSRLFRAVLPKARYEETMSFWKRSNSILMRYVAFDLLDGLIIGVANYIFMKISRMDYATLISVLVGVTNLAPTFGPIIGGAIGAFILVLINPWHALWFLIFTFILQTIDGYVLKPRLFGGSLGVSSVWILIALVVGGRIFGVAGILLAIPFAAIVSFVFTDYVERREAEKAAAGEAKDG